MSEWIGEGGGEVKGDGGGIESVSIGKELMGGVMGGGGKIMEGMEEERGGSMSIEEVEGGGGMEIGGRKKKCMEEGMGMIKGIVGVGEVGEV